LSTVLEQQEFGGVINALIIGDRSLISTKHWALFQATNTTHFIPSVVSFREQPAVLCNLL
jgi:hypothetical protein